CRTAALHTPQSGFPIAAQGVTLDRMPPVVCNPATTVIGCAAGSGVQLALPEGSAPAGLRCDAVPRARLITARPYNDAPRTLISFYLFLARKFVNRRRAWSPMRQIRKRSVLRIF